MNSKLQTKFIAWSFFTVSIFFIVATIFTLDSIFSVIGSILFLLSLLVFNIDARFKELEKKK